MNTFMHPQLFCSALEAIANKGLSLSQRSTSSGISLADKRLCIRLEELGFPIRLQMAEQKLLVTSPNDDNADCTIDTSLSTLYKIKSEHQLTELIKQDQLAIDGDIKVARQYAALIEGIDIDWPAALESHIGDIATHKLLSLVNHIKSKADFVRKQVANDASEYLLHEKKLLVSAAELDYLVKGIEQCQRETESLTERLAQITQRITQLSS